MAKLNQSKYERYIKFRAREYGDSVTSLAAALGISVPSLYHFKRNSVPLTFPSKIFIMLSKINHIAVVEKICSLQYFVKGGGIMASTQTNVTTTPFLKIKEASKVTGLSQYYLRSGCKNGTIPHVKSGNVYLINIPALLRQLDAE